MVKKILAILLVLSLVVIVACAPPAEETYSNEAAVSEDVDEITSIEQDLDTSSMDDLDQDLSEITW